MCSPELSDFETSIWQTFPQDSVYVVGITAVGQNQINQFVMDNGITYPILGDESSGGNGGPGGFGGVVYDAYYIPNQGSPYPRDFIIDQAGTLVYANNEIDTEYMIYLIEDLLEPNSLSVAASSGFTLEDFRLLDPYPNPANNHINLRFYLDPMTYKGKVYLDLFDLNGRLVDSMLDGEIHSGLNTVSLNSNNIGSGLFIVRLSYMGKSDSKKIILLK